MTLSIIIPTYNSESTIKRCLDSILCQSFSDFEVLIMDGVSKDETLQIVSEYQDDRIKIHSEPDEGIYDAMNKGINLSQGEWLYFLGSDDWLCNGSVLDKVFYDCDIEKLDVVYGDVESDFLDKNYIGAWCVKNIEYNRCHQTIFYRKNVFHKIGIYNQKYKLAADHDINIKWLLNAKLKNKYIDLKIAHFSVGGFSCNYIDKNFDQDRNFVIIKNGYMTMERKQYMQYVKTFVKSKDKIFKKMYACLLLCFNVAFTTNK